MALVSIRDHKLGFIQALLYFVCCFCGFFIVIPLGMMLRNFQGSCILFAQIVWDNKVIWPWAETTCEFTLYSNLAVNVIYACMMGLVHVLFMWPRTPERHQDKIGLIENWNVRFIFAALNPVLSVINTVVCIVMVCSAATLSAGLARFCRWLLESMEEEGVDLGGSCLNAASLDWHRFRIRGGASQGVKGENFHIGYGMAIFFSWITVLCWVAQLVICLSQCCRRCSCEIAEEKKKMDKTMIIASRRSGLSTPGYNRTPGHMTPSGMSGTHTPVNMGQPMSQPYRPVPQLGHGGPPQGQFHGGPPQGQFQRRQDAPLNPQVLMGAPPSKGPPPGQQHQFL